MSNQSLILNDCLVYSIIGDKINAFELNWNNCLPEIFFLLTKICFYEQDLANFFLRPGCNLFSFVVSCPSLCMSILGPECSVWKRCRDCKALLESRFTKVKNLLWSSILKNSARRGCCDSRAWWISAQYYKIYVYQCQRLW